MTRDEFKPATTLNILAAAWIQFENHNWFFHGRGKAEETMDVPIADDDDWPEHPMHVRRTVSDNGDRCSSGGRRERQRQRRSSTTATPRPTGGTAPSSTARPRRSRTACAPSRTASSRSAPTGGCRDDPDQAGVDLTGFNENWWFGLSCLHTLFTKEHNAICDVLKKENPRWDDQRLFDTAWLINSALMAKIHTVEWTPGIVNTPALWGSMNINWSGILGQHVKDRFGRFGDSEIFSGIMGSPQEHHGARFQLTEEFVSVYRMHPLIPDDWKLYEHESGKLVQENEFVELQGASTRAFMDGFDMPDLIYSMGIEHPGAITLHNYPQALQRFERIDGELMDLATLDILRDRERGVPRYNDFREEMRMPRVRSFDELTDNQQWAEEIRRVYDNDIDKVDLQVGMYAEPLPPGFGFSDTAFRVFILMASRRLKSDRFFTTDFTPEVYTQTGIDWVNHTKMKDVLAAPPPRAGAGARGHAERVPALAPGRTQRQRAASASTWPVCAKAAEAINA